jgi:ligand-binding sensor domain-containing protein
MFKRIRHILGGHLLIVMFGVSLTTKIQAQEVQVDQWEAYPAIQTIPYLSVNYDHIYCKADNGLLVLDIDLDLEKRSTIVQGIHSNLPTSLKSVGKDTVYTGYQDGTIEITIEGVSKTYDDIERTDRYQAKAIHEIYHFGSQVWLATDFGIVIWDKDNNQVINSYTKFADFERASPVYSLKIESDSVYVGLSSGIASASIQDNLSIDDNWNRYSQSNGFTDERILHIYAFDGHLYVVTANGLCLTRGSNNGWAEDDQWGNRIISQVKSDGDHNLYAIAGKEILKGTIGNISSGNSSSTLYQGHNPVLDLDLIDKGRLVFSEYFQGVKSINVNSAEVKGQSFDSPFSDLNSELGANDSILVKATSRNIAQSDITNQLKGFSAYSEETNQWSNFNTISYFSNQGISFNLTDQIHLDYPFIWANAFGRGVGRYDLKNKEFQYWDASNSNLRGVNYDPQFIAVTDIHGGTNRTYAISYLADEPLYYFDSESNDWKGLEQSNLVRSQEHYFSVFEHSSGLLWIGLRSDLNNGTALLVTDIGDPDDSNDDKSVRLTDNSSGGNLPDPTVTTIVEDQNHEIWLGTQRGVAKYRFPEFVIDGGAADRQAEWLINQDTTAESPYLLREVNVTDMAVNAANQKWIATQNAGLWLVNEDGSRVLKHLTAQNSSLPEGPISAIATNTSKGYVYVGTEAGLVRFTETARSVAKTNDALFIYPNPYRYDSNDGITLDEIDAPADIHILSAGGVKVTEFKASSSRIRWDGYSKFGKQLSSGVYIIIAIGEDGSRQTGKVVIIR